MMALREDIRMWDSKVCTALLGVAAIGVVAYAIRVAHALKPTDTKPETDDTTGDSDATN